MPGEHTAHRRRSVRLPGYNYTQAGACFVICCTHQRSCLFGEVVGGKMWLNTWGQVVQACWEAIPDHFAHVSLDAFVVMPNHVHGVLVLREERPAGDATVRHPRGPQRGSVGAIVGQFKSAATRCINILRGTPGAVVWQHNYYEHVVRNVRTLEAIRAYIQANPERWAWDVENPDRRQRPAW